MGQRFVRRPAAARVADFYLSTPWNQIEEGWQLLLERPLLIAREDGVEGGVFDSGSLIASSTLLAGRLIRLTASD